MRFTKSIKTIALFVFSGVFLFNSCELEEKPTPTHELMQGVWELVEAYDANDSLITDRVTSFYPTYLHLDDMNSVNSTAGPLFMYIVYGDSRFIEVQSKMGDIFKYADLTLTEGEWFIKKNEVVTDFTIEMKLKFPTMDVFTNIMELMNVDVGGIVGDMLDAVIYHKFLTVAVEINDDNDESMTWTFSDETQAQYNTKDYTGTYMSFTGVGVEEFSRCKLKFVKKVESLTNLVNDAAGGQGGK
ncbi:MAG: hypothetical protein C0594_13560 [Marinilabiliales bacterium]|nr:MAG: hypothetical protein C0594_13560 [Marinilabiliales bacterium]